MTEMQSTTTQPEKRVLLEGFVQGQAARLWKGYEADLGSAAAELARLRRALPRAGVTPPEAWEILARDFPQELRGRGDDPSDHELAAISALALFALHQQSKLERSMHDRGSQNRLGRAAHSLMLRTESSGVQRRMRALTRANSFGAALEHLRALITQLRDKEISLDYAQLALDLRDVQRPDRIHRVRERWSRDFNRPIPSTTSGASSTEVAPTLGEVAPTLGENDA